MNKFKPGKSCLPQRVSQEPGASDGSGSNRSSRFDRIHYLACKEKLLVPLLAAGLGVKWIM